MLLRRLGVGVAHRASVCLYSRGVPRRIVLFRACIAARGGAVRVPLGRPLGGAAMGATRLGKVCRIPRRIEVLCAHHAVRGRAVTVLGVHSPSYTARCTAHRCCVRRVPRLVMGLGTCDAVRGDEAIEAFVGSTLCGARLALRGFGSLRLCATCAGLSVFEDEILGAQPLGY